MVEVLHQSVTQHFKNVQSKYTVSKKLGEGTYGLVVAARENATGRQVAIKKIKQAMEDDEQAKLLLRELKLLRHFRGHENVICMRDVIACQDLNDGIYIVLDLMDTDLYRILRSSQKLSDEHIKYFTYQILRGLKFIHSANVMHRDLKPNNLLVNANCDLRICDLGLARMAAETESSFMTVYVVARWYRAPELLLGKKDYELSIDMWATGCILAEMLSRRPLFCGTDYKNMLKLQLATVGSPGQAEVSHLSRTARKFVQEAPSAPRLDWREKFPTACSSLLDLLDSLLQFAPSNRVTAAQALCHVSMADFHDPDDEPDCVQTFDFGYEKENFGAAQTARLPAYPTANADVEQLIREEILQHSRRCHSQRRRNALC